MSEDSKKPESEPLAEATATILSDLLRATIFGLLQKGSLSADEIAATLDVSADRVRSHLRRMLAVGAIHSAGEEPRRGVVQRFYVAAEPLFFDVREYSELDTAQRRALNSSILRLSFTGAARAFVGQPETRPEAVLAQTPMELDEQGWKELVAIHVEALEKVCELKARMLERPPAAAETAIRATSVLICFEGPE